MPLWRLPWTDKEHLTILYGHEGAADNCSFCYRLRPCGCFRGFNVFHFPLMTPQPDPINIFFSYAHEDEKLVKDVQRQLCIHKRLLEISPWHDRQILPGSDVHVEIDARLRSARLILLFVSQYFIASEYCWGIEMTEALRKREAGEASLIPIILSPCDWRRAPFGGIEALPTDGRPITQWRDRAQVCLQVAEGIMRVVNALRGRPNDVTG
jgi:hypothetical protein